MILNKDKNFDKDGSKKSSRPVSSDLGNSLANNGIGKKSSKIRQGTSLFLQSKNKSTILRPGQICDLNITALAPKNIGIDEYSFGFSILVPNAKLGEKIKAKIIKVVNLVNTKSHNKSSQNPLNIWGTRLAGKNKDVRRNCEPASQEKNKYAIATTNLAPSSNKAKIKDITRKLPYIKDISEAKIKPSINFNKEMPKVSDIITVEVEKIKKSDTSNYGIVKTPSNYYIIIPNINQINNLDKKQTVQISFTKVKTKYAFGTLISENLKNKKQAPKNFNSTNKISGSERNESDHRFFLTSRKKLKTLDLKIKKESKMNLILPSQQSLDTHTHFGGKGKQIKLPGLESVSTIKSNFFLLKLNTADGPVLLLIKKGLNAKAGDFVRIKITNKIGGLLFAKIIQINPISKSTKLKLVENDLRLMIQNGLHFGDKALKCNAHMKKYIWHSSPLKKNIKEFSEAKIFNIRERSELVANFSELKASNNYMGINEPTVTSGALDGIKKKDKRMVANYRDGNETPKINKVSVKKNIKTKNNKVLNVLNVLKTRRCLNKVLNLIGKYAIKGKTFLFIGTKKPAAALISKASLLTKNSFFVNTKWLGGMLTNWKTILKSISKIRPILKEKQRVIKDILKKRQNIKTRLIEKALLLRNKSKLILKKGRSLITYLKSNLKEKNKIIYKKLTLKLTQTQFKLKRKNQALIEKRQQLLEKRKKIMLQSLSLKEKTFILLNSYKNIFNDLTITKQKLRELQFLLVLTNLINNLNNQKLIGNLSNLKKEENFSELSPIYTLLKTPTNFGSNSSEKNFKISFGTVLPKEILNIITQFAKSFNNVINKKRSLISGTKNYNKVNFNSFNNNNVAKSVFLNKVRRFPIISGEPASQDGYMQKTNNTKKNNILLVNKVLIKLTQFIFNIKPAVNNLLKQLVDKTKQLVNQAQKIKLALKSVKVSLVSFLDIKKKIVNELKYIKTQLNSEKNFARLLKKKIKQLVSQKRFIQFLPKLRFLPVSQAKITEIVQILMKKIVDPKLKYPIDSIYNQVLNTKLRTYSKKIVFDRKKKWERLEKYFGGIAKVLESTAKITLNNTTKNNKIVAILIGQQEEMNAVRECQKLGIKMIHIVDSNCNPTLADHIIPANDDSRGSIKFVLSKILTRIRIAQRIGVNMTRFNIIQKKQMQKNFESKLSNQAQGKGRYKRY